MHREQIYLIAEGGKEGSRRHVMYRAEMKQIKAKWICYVQKLNEIGTEIRNKSNRNAMNAE
jgi:hypothetical protein